MDRDTFRTEGVVEAPRRAAKWDPIGVDYFWF